MHVFTHVPKEYRKRCRTLSNAADVHCAGMQQHDEDIGRLSSKLKEVGLNENTIVIYSSDNGAEHSSWPDGATTPYRGEKMTTWEGGVRVAMMVRWRDYIQLGTELNGIQSHEDVLITLASAAGVPDIRTRLGKGDALGTAVENKAYIDGVDNLPYWSGKTADSVRHSVFVYEESSLRARHITSGRWILASAMATAAT